MFGAARAAAMEKHHVGVLGAHLVERVPDAQVIVAVGAAGEGDAGAGRARTSVSARRRAAINSRLSMTRAVSARRLTIEPARGRQAEPVVGFEKLGGMVAEEFKGVAVLDQPNPLVDQALEFDRLCAQQCLELGKDRLDRIEIGRVARQEEQLGTGAADQVAHRPCSCDWRDCP